MAAIQTSPLTKAGQTGSETLTRTDTENQKAAGVFSVRKDPKIKQMLLDLETQITATISNISAGFKDFSPPLIAQALSDRELLTLALWAREQDEVIGTEVRRRRDEYEEFTRRLGEHAGT
jgi:hypothetical protein